MPLPATFQFSATSLQDYVDCPRRFQLRYTLQIAWPAPQTEPTGEQEHRARLARDFHRLVHQHLLGLPTDALSASARDPDLARWWRAYLAYAPALGDARVIPEFGLSAPLAGHRAVAQYDAVVIRDSQVEAELAPAQGRPQGSPLGPSGSTQFLILDWKTYRRRPSRDWLAGRLQTRLYPLLLVKAGASLTGGRPIRPNQVEMRYWLAEYPDQPESFRYDEATYQADLAYLTDLITEIAARAGEGESGGLLAEVWPLTADRRRCRFCNYRSLCERGKVAGPVDDYLEGDDVEVLDAGEAGPQVDLDWGQVGETVH